MDPCIWLDLHWCNNVTYLICILDLTSYLYLTAQLIKKGQSKGMWICQVIYPTKTNLLKTWSYCWKAFVFRLIIFMTKMTILGGDDNANLCCNLYKGEEPFPLQQEWIVGTQARVYLHKFAEQCLVGGNEDVCSVSGVCLRRCRVVLAARVLGRREGQMTRSTGGGAAGGGLTTLSGSLPLSPGSLPRESRERFWCL